MFVFSCFVLFFNDFFFNYVPVLLYIRNLLILILTVYTASPGFLNFF